jgi:tetratricopeptide (TPR) repeat protein
MPKADAIMAKQLEQDAEAYPDERTEILIEAAAAWKRAGEPDRAIALLTEIVALGGEDGCFAQADLADLYLAAGDLDRMNATLDVLARDPDLDVSQCELVADMLAEHGDLKAAARWYNRAVARMSAEIIEALGEPRTHSNAFEKDLVRRRREVRRQLGLEPDVLDELADDPPSGAPGISGVPGPGPAAGTHFLMFQRGELPEARRRWPSVFDEAPDDYYARGERVYQDYRNGGLTTIRLVPATASGLAAYAAETGESAEDGALRARFAAAADPATTIAWPPERNAACWCGSDRKYKKCCGRPGS